MVSDKFRLSCSALLALYFVGLGLFLTGFSTDYWRETDTSHAGIWRSCFQKASDNTWNCDSQEVDYYDQWMKVVVAFLILGLLSAIVGGATYMLVPLSASLQLFTDLICPNHSGGSDWFQFRGFARTVRGVCTIISIGVYAAETISESSLATITLGWSYYVTMCGGLCLLANGITLLTLMGCEEEFTMRPILPRPQSTKVGAYDGYNGYPMHTYA